MENKNNNSEKNPLEKQVEELAEWQNNSTNPGYWTISGKTPLPTKNLLKSPIIMFIAGLLFAVITLINLNGNFSIGTLLSNSAIIIVSISFIFSGIVRLLKKD